jgi:putative ABC transport system permease protein
VTARSATRLRTRRLLPFSALVYFYRRRLRAHGTQELLAGVGITVAVALAAAAGIAQGSIAGSSRGALRAVIGPADLQLRARGPQGIPERMLTRVEALPGVRSAAPLLERSTQMIGPDGRRANVYLAGTDVSLGVLDGLGKTLPLSAYTPGTIGLTRASAGALGVDSVGSTPPHVTLLLGGVPHSIPVSSLLGSEAVGGTLARARVAVMPLASMQTLLGQPQRITRVLVQSATGRREQVQRELQAIAGGQMIVSGSEQDVALLEQALRPSAQASALFAVIGALLGFLLAFNAILLTVPERRQAFADLRLSGTRRSAIVQLALFQALCLGLLASAVGIGLGYVLSRWVFHQSTGYLTEAFALNGGTRVPAGTVVLAALIGVLLTCVASAVPLADLRASQPRDAIYQRPRSGGTLERGAMRWLATLAAGLLLATSLLYALEPSAALIASVALALATVLAAPVAFSLVLAAARALSERAPRLPTLAIALGGVRGTSVRSIALAATGAVALFGSVALGGARANLLAGIRSFAHAYAADAPIWVSEPADNQGVGQLRGDGGAARIRSLPGVASVTAFQGGFLTIGSRRVWVIARPAGGARHVLSSQTLGGAGAARTVEGRLGEGGWITLSAGLASELHARPGGRVTLPTPAGPRSYRLAGLTTNLAWVPGAIFMSTADFVGAWSSTAPSVLAVKPAQGADVQRLEREIETTLGSGGAIEVASAERRERKIDDLTGEGLGQLGIISTLLVLAAISALAAALASSIHQRRRALAGLRLTGAAPSRLRRILLVEASLMLGAGCVTGALAGIYGQYVIDAYLRHVTGFPVADPGASARPLEIFALVLAAALAAVALPGWLASRVSPSLALVDE